MGFKGTETQTVRISSWNLAGIAMFLIFAGSSYGIYLALGSSWFLRIFLVIWIFGTVSLFATLVSFHQLKLNPSERLVICLRWVPPQKIRVPFSEILGFVMDYSSRAHNGSDTYRIFMHSRSGDFPLSVTQAGWGFEKQLFKIAWLRERIGAPVASSDAILEESAEWLIKQGRTDDAAALRERAREAK